MSDSFKGLHARTADSVLTVPDIASLPVNAQEGDARWVADIDALYMYTGSAWTNEGGATGPGSSTDNAVARWDGTSGGTLQNSVVTIGDTGVVAGASISGASNTITNVAISTAVSGLGTGVATFLGTPTSANLAAALTDETGSGGVVVFSTAPAIAGGSITALTAFSLRDTSAAFNVPIVATSSTPLNANRTFTIDLKDNNRSLAFGGNVSFGNNFTTGVHDLTFVTAATTSLTLPTSGTLTTTADTLAAFSATTSLQLKGVISDETGSGALVFATSPSLVTPVLGTPSSGTLTSCTGLPISGGTTGTLGSDRGGTGVANNAASTLTISGAFGTTFTVSGATALTLPTSGTVATTSNKLSDFAATTSLELKNTISDETGAGALVFADTPTLIAPILGTPTSGTLTNATGLPIVGGTTGTLGAARGGTGVANNAASTLTISGAFGTTLTVSNTTTLTLPTTGTLATLAGSESLTNKKLGSLTTNGPVYTSAADGTLNSEAQLDRTRGGTGVSSTATFPTTATSTTSSFALLGAANTFTAANTITATTSSPAFVVTGDTTGAYVATITQSHGATTADQGLQVQTAGANASRILNLRQSSTDMFYVDGTGLATLTTKGIKLPTLTSGATASELKDYEETSLSQTFQGNGVGNPSGTITVNITQIGRVVTLTFPSLTVTTTAADSVLTNTVALTTRFRPASGLFIQCIAVTTGGVRVAAPGMIRIQTNGTINLYRDGTAALVYGATTVLEAFAVTYTI